MIGIFDSGVGGLSVEADVRRILPLVSTVYLADTKNFPYGTKSEADVQQFALTAIQHLLAYKPQVIVVACNTASTTALTFLREQFPFIQFIGVVPAIKPAVAVSQNKKIAVLATARTLASPAYAELKHEFADGVSVLDQACSGWVELVEQGHINDAEADAAVRDVIEPLARQGVDVYILGCTHYPFLRSLIQHYAGNAAAVLDSGEAIARQLQRMNGDARNDEPVTRQYLATGSGSQLGHFLKKVLAETETVRVVE